MFRMKRLGFILIAIIILFLLFIIFSKKTPNFLQKLNPITTKTQNTFLNKLTSLPSTTLVGDTSSIPFSLPSGYVIHIFSEGLGSPRDLQFSPKGALLASDPSLGRVYALSDKNKDGIADSKKAIITGENHPHGLAFYQNKLFVAEVDKVVRYNWDEESLTATKDKVLFSLPKNNNHNSRTIVFDDSGKMYVSVGSTCNVCNEDSNLSATILISDADGNNPTVFSKGLRNSPFIQFNPVTGELWGTEMGRDGLGDNLPPDEVNILKQGKNYGWPNCYGNKIADTNFNSNAVCTNTEAPIYEIPAHSAPLGFVFINSSQFPSSWQGDLLVSYHGSWNRSQPTGYKVVHLKVNGNTITGSEIFLDGFIPADAFRGSDSLGRPVDLIFDSSGNLYISDDKAGTVYIVRKNN